MSPYCKYTCIGKLIKNRIFSMSITVRRYYTIPLKRTASILSISSTTTLNSWLTNVPDPHQPRIGCGCILYYIVLQQKHTYRTKSDNQRFSESDNLISFYGREMRYGLGVDGGWRKRFSLEFICIRVCLKVTTCWFPVYGTVGISWRVCERSG